MERVINEWNRKSKSNKLDRIPKKYRSLNKEERKEIFNSLKEFLGEKVVILAHNYQEEEIIKYSDYEGSSFQLSKKASSTDSEYVVFCGVTFMAESADIITSKDQKVLIPSLEASCPMAGMADRTHVNKLWKNLNNLFPNKKVIPITYMNSYSSIKAFAGDKGGIVCTSSNAKKAFKWALNKGDAVLFMRIKTLAGIRHIKWARKRLRNKSCF